MTPSIQIILTFFIGLILVLVSVPVIVRLSKEKKLFDMPNERKVNKTGIPNLGGIALFIGITIATLLGLHRFIFPDLRYILVGMIILFFVGIKDDILIISPRKKLLAQILSALILIIAGNIRFTDLHGILGVHEINYITSVVLSLVIIVALINALNLIDGIDGLAASLSMLAALSFGIQFLIMGQFQYAVLCFSVVGSLSAFFFYNVFGKKNKIFMGDTGSLLLGLLIAVIAIKFNEFSLTHTARMSSFSPALSLAIVAVPIFDMIWLFIHRLRKKKSPFSPDMNHIHHKLLKLNLSHLQSTLIIVGINLVFIAAAYAFRSLNNNILFALLFVLGIFFTNLPSLVYEYIKSKKSNAKKAQLNLTFMPFKNYSENRQSETSQKEGSE